jgi:hypothetical protein
VSHDYIYDVERTGLYVLVSIYVFEVVDKVSGVLDVVKI